MPLRPLLPALSGVQRQEYGVVPVNAPRRTAWPALLAKEHGQRYSMTAFKPYWQPPVNATWQIVLSSPLEDLSLEVDVYDIDLWMNEEAVIENLHDKGSKVICYFSAGSYEGWRPDRGRYQDSDLGQVLDGWPDEKWVDIRSEHVRNILIARLDIAQSMGCDGVDPDNVDGFQNENGLGLTQQDSIEFINWLAHESHSRDMSVGLKNTGSIIPSVINDIEWAVNEQCVEYNECMDYIELGRRGKPVFHIEYATNQVADKEVCVSGHLGNFSTIFKDEQLDGWVGFC